MTATGQRREIVIEYQRIQMIRKRAATYFQLCIDCRKRSDFVSVQQASEIFVTTIDDLLHFAEVNGCHSQTGIPGTTLLCLDTLLAAIKRQKDLKLTSEE